MSALHAAFAFCWRHRQVPATWKVDWRDKQEAAIQDFLNAELKNFPFATRRKHCQDIESSWSDLQRTMQMYSLHFDRTADAEPLYLKVPYSEEWLEHKTVLRQVKLHMKLRHSSRWTSMTDQGRTTRIHGGTNSSFIFSGARLADTDYIFAIRGRINQSETGLSSPCVHKLCTQA